MGAGMIVVWIACGIAAGAVASNKGRSVGGWTFIGVLLGPVGVLLALVVAPNQSAMETSAIASGASRQCPYCAEIVRSQAVVCKHCGRDLEPLPAPPAPKPVDPDQERRSRYVPYY